jgi:hypothetical protein
MTVSLSSKVPSQTLTVTKEEKETFKKNYFTALKQNIPFFANLQYLLRTEENDFCLVFKCFYNPGLLFSYFHGNDQKNKSNDTSNRNGMEMFNPKFEKAIQFYAAEMVLLIERLHQLGLILGFVIHFIESRRDF